VWGVGFFVFRVGGIFEVGEEEKRITASAGLIR
jgi:hypothetical protein